MIGILKDISREGSWIASIHPLNGKKHAVIVDKIVEKKIFLRDPWPLEGIGNTKGIVATADLKDFSEVWLRAGTNRFTIK